jgi:hypothetical protein
LLHFLFAVGANKVASVAELMGNQPQPAAQPLPAVQPATLAAMAAADGSVSCMKDGERRLILQ